MSIDQRWILALSAVVAGFLLGVLLAASSRRLLGADDRRSALKAIATPTGTFLFWLSVVTGLVAAIGFTSPETLQPIPSDLLAWLPRVLVAGLLVLAGYAGGGAISAAVAAGAHRALGHRPAGLERSLRWIIMGAAIVLALGNIGVETTLLQILVAGVVFSFGLAFALVAGLGGNAIAASVAAGRTLGPDLHVGDQLTVGAVTGQITTLRPATVILSSGDRTSIVIPLAELMSQPFQIEAGEQGR